MNKNLLSGCNSKFSDVTTNYSDTISYPNEQNSIKEYFNEESGNNNVIWYKDPTILFRDDNWQIFVPKRNMTNTQMLNSIFRFSLYGFILLSMIQNSTKSIIFPITVAIGTIFLNYFKIENFEQYHENFTQYQKPSETNPFMNPLITDLGKHKNEASLSHNDPIIKKNIEYEFHKNLYKDVNDLYNKSNNQNRFYTVPNTNEYGMKHGDTVKFANWLYNIPAPTCKEDSMYCTNNRAQTFDNYKRLRSQKQFL